MFHQTVWPMPAYLWVIVQQVISLPMHTELADDQIDFITDHINKFLG